MDMVEKSINATVETVESNNPNGEFEAVLSTEALDRDKEHLWSDEWKQPLPARIHIDGDHGRSIEKTVGSAIPRLEGNQLIAKGSFAGTEYAQMVRQLVNEGHIRELSVTYTEHKNQKDNSVQRELLNAAFVAIPANPEAVVLSSKSAQKDDKISDDKSAKVGTMDSLTLMQLVAKAAGGTASRSVKHDDMVQAVHDAAGQLGAHCLDIDYEPAVDPGLKAQKAAGGLTAGGDNPQVPKHDAMVQAVHDAAWHLGAQCLNEIDADPGTADGANKSRTDVHTKSSSTENAGSPQESAEESAAAETAEKSAVSAAADESADAAKERLALSARSLEFLMSKNFKE